MVRFAWRAGQADLFASSRRQVWRHGRGPRRTACFIVLQVVPMRPGWPNMAVWAVGVGSVLLCLNRGGSTDNWLVVSEHRVVGRASAADPCRKFGGSIAGGFGGAAYGIASAALLPAYPLPAEDRAKVTSVVMQMTSVAVFWDQAGPFLPAIAATFGRDVPMVSATGPAARWPLPTCWRRCLRREWPCQRRANWRGSELR